MTSRVGDGAVSVPPTSIGSSTTSVALRRPGAPPSLEQGRIGDVGVAGHRPDEVGGAVQVGGHGARSEIFLAAQGGDPALGPAQGRPGEVEGGGELGAAGDHELRRQLDPLHVAVDRRFQRADHLAGDPADAVLEPSGRLRRRGELGAGDEQVGLQVEQVALDLPLAGTTERAGDPERRAGLVDRPVGLDPGVRLRPAAAVPEAGRAVVALARVDLHRPGASLESGLKTMPVSSFGKK